MTSGFRNSCLCLQELPDLGPQLSRARVGGGSQWFSWVRIRVSFSTQFQTETPTAWRKVGLTDMSPCQTGGDPFIRADRQIGWAINGPFKRPSSALQRTYPVSFALFGCGSLWIEIEIKADVVGYPATAVSSGDWVGVLLVDFCRVDPWGEVGKERVCKQLA